MHAIEQLELNGIKFNDASRVTLATNLVRASSASLLSSRALLVLSMIRKLARGGGGVWGMGSVAEVITIITDVAKLISMGFGADW